MQTTSEVVAHPAPGRGGRRRVVLVTLRNTRRLNAMSRAMWRQLRSVFESIQRNTDARCVLIEGEGDAFCAGGDISGYPSRFDPAQLRDFHENDVWGGLSAMLACDVPIVAHRRRLHGRAWRLPVAATSASPPRARFGAPLRAWVSMAPREGAAWWRAPWAN